jgi:hypothetical protein
MDIDAAGDAIETNEYSVCGPIAASNVKKNIQ